MKFNLLSCRKQEKNHLEINLGSEKKFKTINFNSDEILIETSINENFIPNYFNDDNKLKNITAVVGKNGSGKTSLLNQLFVNILTGNTNDNIFTKRIFIYKDVNGKYYYWTSLYKPQFKVLIDKSIIQPTGFYKQSQIEEGQPKVFYDNLIIPFSNKLNFENDTSKKSLYDLSSKSYLLNSNGNFHKYKNKIVLDILNTLNDSRKIFNKEFVEVKDEFYLVFKESILQDFVIEKMIKFYNDDNENIIFDKNLLLDIKNDLSDYENIRNKKVYESDYKQYKYFLTKNLYYAQLHMLFYMLSYYFEKIDESIFKKYTVEVNCSDVFLNMKIINLEEKTNDISSLNIALEDRIDAFNKLSNLFKWLCDELDFSEKNAIAQNYFPGMEGFNNTQVSIYFKVTISKAKEINQKLDCLYTCGNKISNQPFSLTKKANMYESLFYLSSEDVYSSGEMNYIQWLSTIYSSSTEITGNVLLLLDEVDLTFHPAWKRKFVRILADDMIKLFPKADSLQIVYTTHSPITLSDMPLGNIIYLDKKNERCTIVSKNEKTIGANINNLFKNSFFLDEGLMGELAQNKIKSLAEYLNGDELSKSEKWSIKIFYLLLIK